MVSNFEYFTYQAYMVAISLPKEGVYTDLTLKLDNIFQLYEYNTISGKFDIQSTFGQINDYVSFKFNYYDRGAMTHEDSVYNVIGTNGVGGVIWGK